jgi:hypothetical protein
LNANAPDVRTYLTAFEATVKFERKLSERFATTKIVYIGPDDPMPEFENTPAGISAKLQWRMRKEEGIGEEQQIPANEFLGKITIAFSLHISIYLKYETEQMNQIISDTQKRLQQDIDEVQHQLKSLSVLVNRMREAIGKCSRFNLPQALLDLFREILGVLQRYAEFLTSNLPSKPKEKQDYELMAAIANTSGVLLSIIDSLATNVSSLVPEELKSAVVVDDAKGGIGAQLKQQLLSIVDVLAKEYESTLAQIGTGVWDQSDPEPGKLPSKLPDLFQKRFSLLGSWLSNDNMNRLRSPFTIRIVTIVRNSIFKQKQFVMDLGWRISTAVKELKLLVIQWTRADSTLAKRRIDTDFLQLEVEVRVLYSPDPVAMAVTYISIWSNHSKDHYRQILKVRGLPSKDNEVCMLEYDRQLAELNPNK